MKRIILLMIIQFIAVYGFSQITGTVYDENGEKVPGVNLVIKGTTTGTISNFDGSFELSASSGDTVLVSFIGYKNQEFVVDRENQKFEVTLESEAYDIEELVVMGYSNKTKNEISSAVTTISDERLNDSPSSDVGTLLQGKVSGVQVVNSSGAPGSGAEVRIRGVSTIKPGNAEPLYVVDGIIGGTFDPNDVESITVLKDAGSTGMYGARANKGVIVVTTKSAKSDKTIFEFKANYGFNIADQGNLQMMDGQQFYDWSSELYRDEDTHSIDKIRFYDDYNQSLSKLNYNWVDEAFNPAPIQKYYLSARGRNEKLGYYLSGSYYNEEGTFDNTGYERLNLRANTNYRFNDRVSVKNNINISASSGTSYDYMDMYYTYLGVPWDNPFNKDGTPRYIDGSNAKKLQDGTGWWSRDPINPFHTIENSDHNYKDMGVSYDFVLDVQIFDWLKFSSSNRLSFSTTKSHDFVSPVVAGTYNDKGYVSENQSIWYGGISTNLFKVDKDFDLHSISGLIGGEFDKGFSEIIGVSGTGLPDGFDVPSVASGEYAIEGSNSREMFRSFISQLNYAYNGVYFLTGSYRIDATSNFPSNNRVAHFPSISGAVLLNKLSFMSAFNSVDMLKLRSSYGITGDPEIGASRYLGLFSLSTQYNGNPAAIPYQLANPDLTWEQTNQFNIGADLEMFDRVNFSIDYYNNVTNNLIILAAQPLSQGFESRYENSGSVINNGIELSLSTVNVQKANFKFTSEITFAKNNNELTGIDDPITSTIGGVTQKYQNGYELYTFYLPKWLGVDTETGSPLWEKVTKDEAGNVVTREATSEYSKASPQAVGSALPDFTGGVNISLVYKNISFYASGVFQYGNDVYNATRIFMDNDGHEPYYNNMVAKDDWSRWEKPGDVATHPSMQNSSLSTETSSRFLEDGSFFKIRNASLQYKFPKNWLRRSNINDVSVSLTGTNLFTFTDYWGQDPEVTINKQTWSMPGVSDFKYPNNKQFIFSVNVKF
jgi:TonB-linked SusC/RagA family outer membrane protein